METPLRPVWGRTFAIQTDTQFETWCVYEGRDAEKPAWWNNQCGVPFDEVRPVSQWRREDGLATADGSTVYWIRGWLPDTREPRELLEALRSRPESAEAPWHRLFCDADRRQACEAVAAPDAGTVRIFAEAMGLPHAQHDVVDEIRPTGFSPLHDAVGFTPAAGDDGVLRGFSGADPPIDTVVVTRHDAPCSLLFAPCSLLFATIAAEDAVSDTWQIVLGLIAVLALVALNGLFVATEFAYVAVRKSRVEQLANQGNRQARVLLASLRDLDHYIAATQLGITMSSLALGWLGEPAVGRLVEPLIEEVTGPFLAHAVAAAIAVILSFAIITAFHIIFGELAPKTIALQRSEATALWVSAPILVFSRVFRPFIWALNGAGRAVVRPMGLGAGAGHESQLSSEEIEIVMQSSARAGLLSTSELLLARRALEFSEIQADQIMVPRTELVAFDVEEPLDTLLVTVEQQQHTRYPVYERDLDHIVGILDVKDLIAVVRSGGTAWRQLVRPAVAIPESVSVEVAVAAMRARQVQIVVLVDEHGGTSGILTADEVLYRLLGRWLGGRGQGHETVRTLPTGNLLLSGLALIADVEEATGAELSDEDYDTVGGFVMSRLGRIPRIGDRIDVAGYEFRVMAMDGRRVDRVLVLKKEPAREL